MSNTDYLFSSKWLAVKHFEKIPYISAPSLNATLSYIKLGRSYRTDWSTCFTIQFITCMTFYKITILYAIDHVKRYLSVTIEKLMKLHNNICTCLYLYIKEIREHPLNLKGGYDLFRSQNIFFFASQHSKKEFSRQIVATLFFFYKKNIF